MPSTTEFIDSLRDAFGAEAVNPSIKAGIAGEGTFYACENGQEIGSRPRQVPGSAVNGHDQARARPCDGCKHASVRLVSPDGHRLQLACKLYRNALQRCADWAAK